MKFDYSFDEVLTLKITFEDRDYEEYFESYDDVCSQLTPITKSEFWGHRKTVIVHDMITMYCKMEVACLIDDDYCVDIFIDDRGEKRRFTVNPYYHCQEMAFCKYCVLEDMITKDKDFFDESSSSSSDTLILCSCKKNECKKLDCECSKL